MISYFCYSFNLTRTPTFRCIIWTPYVALTASLLDVVFDQYGRQGMGGEMPPKTHNEFIVARFCLAISPMVVMSVL